MAPFRFGWSPEGALKVVSDPGAVNRFFLFLFRRFSAPTRRLESQEGDEGRSEGARITCGKQALANSKRSGDRADWLLDYEGAIESGARLSPFCLTPDAGLWITCCAVKPSTDAGSSKPLSGGNRSLRQYLTFAESLRRVVNRKTRRPEGTLGVVRSDSEGPVFSSPLCSPGRRDLHRDALVNCPVSKGKEQ